MPGLDKFSDFQLLTRDIKLTGPEELLNEATLHNYVLGDMVAGRENDHIFRGGTKLTERIMARDNGSFRTYKPNDELNPVAADTMKRISANWRFTVGGYTWNDNEILLNEGDPARYGDLKLDYEQQAMTSIVNGMEALNWTVPSTTDMEDDGGEIPYSIPTFVQEGGGAPLGFTTVMGLNPTTETWWKNQSVGYTGANIESPDSSTGLFTAFDKMLRLVQFDKINVSQAMKYWEDLDLRKMRIYTSGQGRDVFVRLVRQKNNRLVVAGPQDAAYPDPRWEGYPIQWIESLDTAKLYANTATAGGNASTKNADGSEATGYPRFYFLNLKYLFVCFHEKKYFDQVMRDGGARQPFTNVMWIDTYYNLVCRSRRRQGILWPTAV